MDELDRRVPLALGHWHAHRNICVPKRGRAALTKAERHAFGFSGSIATRSACDAAGGFFMDNVYGWMMHVYPFEPTLAAQFYSRRRADSTEADECRLRLAAAFSRR